jgi:hypothetical protein
MTRWRVPSRYCWERDFDSNARRIRYPCHEPSVTIHRTGHTPFPAPHGQSEVAKSSVVRV